MKLRIRESNYKPKHTRRSKWDIISELKRNGYTLLDAGYGDWHYYTKGYENDFIVKGFFNKTDAPGLKMYSLYGKPKDSTYSKWYNALYDFAKENYPDNWTPYNLERFYNKYHYIGNVGTDCPNFIKALYVEVNNDLMSNEGFEEPSYFPEYYNVWKTKI